VLSFFPPVFFEVIFPPPWHESNLTLLNLSLPNYTYSNRDLIYPLFIHDDADTVEIASMPGCFRHSLDSMMREVEAARKLGVQAFILFPKIPAALKSNMAEECYNPTGIVPRALGMLRKKFPDVVLCTDVALDPYSNQVSKRLNCNGTLLHQIFYLFRVCSVVFGY
jgi:delta-aminolevulinic acid dehydratase/porphobilinogen synthase